MKQLVNLIVCAALSFLVGIIAGASIGLYGYRGIVDEVKNKE